MKILLIGGGVFNLLLLIAFFLVAGTILLFLVQGKRLMVDKLI